MTGLAGLRPGDIMFGPIGGIVPGVLPVGVGQIMLAGRKARLSWREWWRIRHVGVVVGARLVQAMPRGAEEIELTAKHWTSDYVYLRPMLDNSQGVEIATAARGYVGTPYNFLTYGKLAAGALRMHATETLLRRWISSRADMMCSQLADQALADAGVHVFDDDRLPGDVVPAELFRALLARPGTEVLVP